jgi:hypothetical protein
MRYEKIIKSDLENTFTRNRSKDIFLLSSDMCLMCVFVYGAKTHMDGLFQQRTCRRERNITRLEGTQLSALNTSDTSLSNKKTH